VIVVYKVDRLTCSLADFAKLVELFDEHQVSLVSVTQAFNTTPSMGRLTLSDSIGQENAVTTGRDLASAVVDHKIYGHVFNMVGDSRIGLVLFQASGQRRGAGVHGQILIR
jgi:hypothetical protein